MKKTTIAILGGVAMISALAAGYFFGEGMTSYGVILAAVTLILGWFLLTRVYREHKREAMIQRAFENPIINLAFCGELSRLIDEGKDINGYLRECGAPENVVKSVCIGGTTRWYYHKDDTPFDEFRSEFPLGEAPFINHPNVTDQRTEQEDDHVLHIIRVDLYRALWDWGELHPEKKRYTNSMRIAFYGAYKINEETGGNSYLDMTIEEVRAARKANRKKPKKKRKKTDGI